MSRKLRQTFSPEFKHESVRLLEQGNKAKYGVEALSEKNKDMPQDTSRPTYLLTL